MLKIERSYEICGLGTSMGVQDTDGDGLLDGVEYPPAGAPFSDPRISDIIFEDGFE